MIDVTSRIEEMVERSGMQNGAVTCFVPHTTAAVTINENADPDVTRDILYKLGREFPQSDGYRHAEGNSDAHVKSSLTGCSEILLVESGKLLLGTWQGIYFCEFDGPRIRRLIVRIADGT